MHRLQSLSTSMNERDDEEEWSPYKLMHGVVGATRDSDVVECISCKTRAGEKTIARIMGVN
jgi:hypothetical protein